MKPDGSESILNVICTWLNQHYEPQHDGTNELVLANPAIANQTALSYVTEPFDVGAGYHYIGRDEYACDLVPRVTSYFDERPASRSGAVEFHFSDGETHFDVLLVAAWVYDADMHNTLLTVASVPSQHITQWLAFEKECQRIYHSAIPYRGKVYIVGGIDTSFDATVHWEDIYLPPVLKSEILKDIDAFFQKGVNIYQRLNIKPFRKILFAGVPGTGKTMLCSAIAGWAQERDYFVVYVSGSNQYGAKFWKIHEALEMAASSDAPTIVLVEELDAYLEEESKAQMLNVLDGSESPNNKHGTILIATTNHPEKIDDRVMKRPGRLDRVFIIPEMESESTARKMLKEYLGDNWREEHAEIVPDLLGRPGAFIREVALYALTMAAYEQEAGAALTKEMLQGSLQMLVSQIEAKDDFLVAHKKGEMGLATNKKARRNGFPRSDSES